MDAAPVHTDIASAALRLQFSHKVAFPAIPQAFPASTVIEDVLAPWQAIDDRGAFGTQAGHAIGLVTVLAAAFVTGFHSPLSQFIHAHAPVPAALPVAGKPTQCLQFLADQSIHDAMPDQQHRPLGGKRHQTLGGSLGAPPGYR